MYISTLGEFARHDFTNLSSVETIYQTLFLSFGGNKSLLRRGFFLYCREGRGERKRKHGGGGGDDGKEDEELIIPIIKADHSFVRLR